MAARMTCLLVPVRLRATSLVGTQLGRTCSANILEIEDAAHQKDASSHMVRFRMPV